MTIWMIAAAALVAATIAADLLSLTDLIVFALAAASLVPVAGLIGQATEKLAHHLGPRAGGLLNATFGNAAELIITGLAVHQGLLTLVKASLTGSVIGNTLLILGMSLVAGGARHGVQRYDDRETSVNAAMMILAVAGLYLPATFAASVQDPRTIEELSLLMAGVLLVTYIAYLGYTVVQGQPAARPKSKQRKGKQPGVAGTGAEKPSDSNAANHEESSAGDDESNEGEDGGDWGIWRAVIVLAIATAGAAVSSELLVRTVEPVSRDYGISEFFVGVIIVPIVGNAAEHFSALQMAWNNRLDVTLAIAAGSSTQIALFVAPALVFASLLLGHPMSLIFRPLELVILGLATAIFAFISLDGESNWLEGVQLLAIYVMAGMAFFFLPMSR
ncbi:MAG: calcium/proton exchanger [Chloroflexota bacterium]